VRKGDRTGGSVEKAADARQRAQEKKPPKGTRGKGSGASPGSVDRGSGVYFPDVKKHCTRALTTGLKQRGTPRGGGAKAKCREAVERGRGSSSSPQHSKK